MRIKNYEVTLINPSGGKVFKVTCQLESHEHEAGDIVLLPDFVLISKSNTVNRLMPEAVEVKPDGPQGPAGGTDTGTEGGPVAAADAANPAAVPVL